MHLDVLLLADMANADSAGKLNVIGEFNMLWTKGPPTDPINIAVVVRLIAMVSEGAEHKVSISVVDEDGKEIARSPGVTAKFAPVVPGTSGDLRAQFVLNMNRAVFPRLGTYSFQVVVDGRYVAGRALHVVKRPDIDSTEAVPSDGEANGG